MFPKTQFEAAILLLAVGIAIYFAWTMGRRQAHLPLDQMQDEDAFPQQPAEPVDTPLPQIKADQVIQQKSELCDSCADPDNQCSAACTSDTTIRMCEDLRGYANIPRLPCPIDEEGVSSYAMFRAEPHVGVGLGADPPLAVL